MTEGLEQVPGEWVNFAPPPADVISRRGVAAAAFTEFGLT
ncbi:hypothetical protein ES708_29107 [subsurface metagenome]